MLKRFFAFAYVVVVVPFFWCGAVFANDDLTANQVSILQRVLAVGSAISRADHDAFWRDVPSGLKQRLAGDPALRSAWERESSRAMMIAPEFAREGWRSALASVRSHKVVRTDRYIELRPLVLAAFPPEQRDLAKNGIQNSERLIEAAASGRPLSTPKGEVVISEEMANTVLAGLDASMDRARRLMDPQWK